MGVLCSSSLAPCLTVRLSLLFSSCGVQWSLQVHMTAFFDCSLASVGFFYISILRGNPSKLETDNKVSLGRSALYVPLHTLLPYKARCRSVEPQCSPHPGTTVALLDPTGP
ncbi:uncharacterized protein BDW43DRAFT_22325 [Aspergillus alliaceus]|uniref:uncharacterized protein n=1 Tax=Petromyces alliaceus TaxID=209559 RepID=UPI0012A43B67|nr:uncharacterized protein BDW43DRAFT_22325 [Aspergillus alliaceus]KAB8227046.1 hypothetical protein BDW43DRAFT_22325 [Aspergillus alliaceus]